jgi:chitinase|tara:strand:- start:5941 stop:7275 length:1335 start_codon:yes stop_codon:yes gene_type:complete
MKLRLLFFLLIGFAYSQRVVGYYPYWIQDEFQSQDFDLETFTHINHAFAWPNEQGGIEAPSGTFDASIADHIHNNNRKFLLSLGGWGTADGFAAATSTYELRSVFISNILDIFISYGYDGADIDWEYPQTNEQRNNLSLFIAELDSVLDEFDPELLITMALPTSNWAGQWYDMNSLNQHVDYFNAMTYDIHGSWSNHAGHNSPLYQSPPGDADGSVQTGINYLVNTRELPENKINMGIPFWGKKYNASTINGYFTGSVTDLRYYDIVELINNGWTSHWDDVAKCPYLINTNTTQIITYDDPLSIQFKCEFAQNRNLGGVMVWAMGYDNYDAEESLTNSINTHWLNLEKSVPTILPNQIELESYPNPFNSQMQIKIYLPKAGYVNLSLFDINGRAIQRFAEGYFIQGNHSFQWRNAHNQQIASGVYLVMLQTRTSIHSKKIVYLK